MTPTEKKYVKKLIELIKLLDNALDCTVELGDAKLRQEIWKLERQIQEEIITDAELLQDIYDRADTVTLYGSDLYLRGFKDGLDYRNLITDTDIEAWAKKRVLIMEDHINYRIGKQDGLIEGAKAMRDGKIKHIEDGDK